MQSYLSSVEYVAEEIHIAPGQVRHSHRWLPDGVTPWASLTVIHGFGDHGGRFAGMATSLASFGIAVSAIDLIGHGRSPGRRGCIASYEQLLDEVQGALQLADEQWPRIPKFLFGQSMGGNLVLNWAIRRRLESQSLQGIMCGSPMLRTPSMPKENMMDAGRWLAKRLPHWRIRTPVDATKLSHDRRAQDAYLRDPLVHRSMSLRLATELVDSGRWAIDNASNLAIPTLILHGAEDTLTCPKASAEFAKAAGSIANFRAWPGCRHDLHDELQRERVFMYMSGWMKQRCIVSYKITASSILSASALAA